MPVLHVIPPCESRERVFYAFSLFFRISAIEYR
jgi:hypothetical protein